MVKNSKRKQDIKSKLIAAIAMLMVATIMMVSSTYAWFTLSTAPEVQGISTNVGSNGNLEIALSPNTGAESDVGDGDSSDDWNVKNLTWGNQLNLAGLYGLEGINLFPAQLNGGSLTSVPLSTPVYGADGRIDELAANTMIGGKVDGKDGWVVADNIFGVRVVGTSSSQTEYQIAFNQQYANLGVAYKGVQNKAQAGLNANGSALAEMAIKHAQAGSPDGEEYKAYLPALNSLIDSLIAANNDLEQAIRSTIWAAAASNMMKAVAADPDALEEEEIETIVANYELLTGLLEGNNTMEEIWASSAIPAELKGTSYLGKAYTVWSENKTTLEGAKTRLTTLATYDTVKWADDGETKGAGPVVTVLMDTDGVTINGEELMTFKQTALKAITEVKEEDYTTGDELDVDAFEAAKQEKQEALQYCLDMATGGIRLEMGAESGIYSELAALVGDIHATVEDVNVDIPTIGEVPLDVALDTTTGTLPLFSVVREVLGTEGALDLGDAVDTDQVIEDYYGYIVDFMFRTNASGSKLKLQTEATDRIYGEDGNNQDTMGGGSTMTFTSDALDENGVKGLMKALRVVFFDTVDGTQNGVAKLDEATFTSEVNAVTGKTEITAELYLYDGDVKASEELCDLPTNTAKAVSALVYMDGNNITNKDVAANAQSMTGSMNLQFASSADLVPMENSALRNMEASAS